MPAALNNLLIRLSSSSEYIIKLLLLVSAIEALTRAPTYETSWHLEAAPRAAWVLLEKRISVNCLNFTTKYTVFASDISWFKLANNGTIVYLPTSLDARVRSNGHQLQIFNAKVDDEGLYCCKPVHSVSNCSELAVANISVAQPPVIVALLKHQAAKIGDVVILQCKIAFVGKPAAMEYSWQKFGRNLALQQSKYTTENLMDLFILIIHNVTETDEGLYSCFLINSKYQKANESIYLQVSRIQNESSERCNQGINATLFVGLYMASNKSCDYMKNTRIDDLLTAFTTSLCNCTEFCINVNIISCLNVSVAIIKISLHGAKAVEIYNTLIALLQGKNLPIQDTDYLLMCLSPWCNAGNMTSDVTSTVLEASLESNCDIEILFFCLLVIVILLAVAIAVIYYNRRNQLNVKKQTSCIYAETQPNTKETQPHYLTLNNLKQTAAV